MVTAEFKYIPEKGALAMTVKGHASFADLGKDPVCAGASILAMSVAQCAVDLGERGMLQKKPNVTIHNGRVTVVIKPKEEYLYLAFSLFGFGQRGMQLLEESYPENVRLLPFETAKADSK